MLRVCVRVALLALVAVLALAAAPSQAASPVASRLLQTAAGVPPTDAALPEETTDLLVDGAEQTATDEELSLPTEEHTEEAEESAFTSLLTSVSVCAQRGGTCKATSSGCSGGSFATGLCPGAANIKCCLPTNSVCQQRGGSCKHTSVGCSGGSFSSGLCPGDANIKCCLASSSACSQRGGTCKATSNGCSGGSFTAGLCPGASNIQCCLASSSACSQRGGTCKATSSGCSGGSFTAGLCPGASNIQCCMASSSACASRGGTCKATSSGCSGGSFTAGLCPGASNIQCCMNACQTRGGTCKDTSSGCSGGSFTSGLCPGGASNKCCLPGGGGGGSCGVYTNSAVQNIIGNGNRNYGVVAIVREHLTNPAIAGKSPHDEDNTMLRSTACAFDAMHNAAKRAGIRLTINSAFRTYNRQVYFWNCYQTKKCNNGNLAAYPGTSNHGVGLALDIATGGGAYNWLKNNAHAFGFVRTVPSETWHWEHRPGSPPAPYT